MIIVGYQGIGKSTAAGKNGVIDLESGNFFIENENGESVRSDDWYKIYANIADHLSKQGYVVMTASHKVFRDYMDEKGIEYITMSPSVELKDAWIKKLEDRYNQTNLIKDYKALMNAKDKYVENVTDLQKGNYCIIDDINYNLVDMVEDLKVTSKYF